VEKPIVGSVMVTSFPFSNLKAHKNRPALVLGISDFNDVVLCQITSISDGDLQKIKLTSSSFSTGGLPIESYVRPDKLFTADSSLISKTVGQLKPSVVREIKTVLKNFLNI
jgi:mRNA interferase MazF